MTNIIYLSRKKYWEAKIDASQTSAYMARRRKTQKCTAPIAPIGDKIVAVFN
jgi:hypothetical protein